MTVELLRIVLALGLVIGIIIVVSRILQNRTNLAKNQILKVIGFLNFGPRKAIAVVKAGKEVMLLAITQNDIKLLKTYPEEEFDLEIKNIRDNLIQIKGLKEALRREIR